MATQPTREQVLRFLDAQPRDIRYRAALAAQRAVGYTYLCWLLDHEGPTPSHEGRCGFLAVEAVESWLKGEAEPGELVPYIRLLERQAAKMARSEDPRTELAALICASVLYLVVAVVRETLGASACPNYEFHACDSVLTVALVGDAEAFLDEAFLFRGQNLVLTRCGAVGAEWNPSDAAAPS